MVQRWSEQIEQRYALRLSPPLQAWLDEEIWRRTAVGEFRDPLTPEEILDPPPGIIWAGFMLPDTLPLIGNAYGDWLCVRVEPGGRAGEIVCWNHGGGDWIPYGRNVAEALVYDAARRGLAAGDLQPEHAAGGRQQASDWACRWLTAQGRLPACPRGAEAVGGECLLEAGIAEAAIRRDRALAFLNSPLKTLSEPPLAEQLNVAWEPEFVRWLFDTDLIPPAARTTLARRLEQPPERLFHQNWAAAEAEALAVIRLRQDLGWPYHLAGWAAERRGDLAAAVALYAAGLRTSLFADQAVSFRTHWFAAGFGKFAAARLAALGDAVPRDLRRDEYLQLFWENHAASLPLRLRSYWLQSARRHYHCQQYLQAFFDFYRAGWDLGLSDLDGYAEILDGLDTSATAAGAVALARVVQTHRSCLPV